MTLAEKYEITMRIVLVGVVLLYLVVIYRQYQKNKMALSTHQNTVIVSPSKIKFLISWYIYFLMFYIPIAALLWSIKSLEEVSWVYLFLMPIGWLFNAIPAYSYYSLSIYENKFCGAPMLGLFWQRAEVDFSDIDKEKTAQKNFLQKLGIIFFYATSGEKIMTFGLDDLQVSQVLTMKINENVQ